MKNKIVKAGLCVMAASMLLSAPVFGSELAREYDDSSYAITSSVFWRKKDQDNETPQTSPEPSATPTVAPKDATTPNVAPQESTPKAPETTPKDAPKETSEKTPTPNQQAPQQQAPQQTPQQAPKTDQPKETSENTESNNETAMAFYNNPGSTQSQGGSASAPYQHNNAATGKVTDYVPGITTEIHKLLAAQPSIQLDPNAYIVQLDDGLWLIMGNIRAKLDILIYVDQKNMQEAGVHGGSNAIPMYK
ncbi:MAG: hypothetical protein FWE34_04805 [Defluviitaleaceae bacterium]|nr:hypothetical protein [Defluviitaleaceae bacterium]